VKDVKRCVMCRDLGVPCIGCLVDHVQEETERETIARVVAWLRARPEAAESTSGIVCRVLADAIERGDYRGHDRGNDR
jgi:hypothetical protein